MESIRSHKQLRVYKSSMEAAMSIFGVTRGFPREEVYSLTDQIRRSSRSVSANIAEAWRRRRYRAAFINKLNEAECEAAETQTWLEYAFRCQYLDTVRAGELSAMYEGIMRQLVHMQMNADDWLIRERKVQVPPAGQRDVGPEDQNDVEPEDQDDAEPDDQNDAEPEDGSA